MNYQVDRTEQLNEAIKRGRFGSVASLRTKLTPFRKHNVEKRAAKASVPQPAKKSTPKKAVVSKPVKKTTKKTTKKPTTKKS